MLIWVRIMISITCNWVVLQNLDKTLAPQQCMVWLIQWNLKNNRALKIKSQVGLLLISRKWYSESKRKHSTSTLTVQTQNRLSKGSTMLNLSFRINRNISMKLRILESNCVNQISIWVSKDHRIKSFILQIFLTQRNVSQTEEPNQCRKRQAVNIWRRLPLWLKDRVRCLIAIICSS